MYDPVLRDAFWSEGRGPELRCIHYTVIGTSIAAIDYLNPDWKSERNDLRHLAFRGVQTFMVTPEEVHNFATDEVKWGEVGGAAIANLHRSKWLLSFDQQHLSRCNHYRILFYDQIVDILCEAIVPGLGSYQSDFR